MDYGFLDRHDSKNDLLDYYQIFSILKCQPHEVITFLIEFDYVIANKVFCLNEGQIIGILNAISSFLCEKCIFNANIIIKYSSSLPDRNQIKNIFKKNIKFRNNKLYMFNTANSSLELLINHRVEASLNNDTDNVFSYLSTQMQNLDVGCVINIQNDIKSIQLLSCICPCIQNKLFIIDRGGIIKQCSLPIYENIVGFVKDNLFHMLEKNHETIQFNSKCINCRFLYVCLGYNCKYCKHSEFICQPRYEYMRNILTSLLKGQNVR